MKRVVLVAEIKHESDSGVDVVPLLPLVAWARSWLESMGDKVSVVTAGIADVDVDR